MKRLVLADLLIRYRMLIGVAIGTAAFAMMFSGTYEAFGGAAALNTLFNSNTQSNLFSAFTGSRDLSFIAGPLQYVAFGFNHPLFFVMTMSIGVGIGSSAVAGDIESGRAELLYTRSLRRSTVYDTRVGVWVIVQLIVILAGLLGAYAGAFLSEEVRQDDLGRLVWVCIQYLPLAAVAGALAFCVSAFRSTRSSAIGLTVGILAGAYLANLMAILWDPAAFLQWISPFGYYEPLAAVDAVNWSDAAVLSTAAVVLFLVGRWKLTHRDLN